MIQKKKRNWCAMFLLGLNLISLNAQNTLWVNGKSNTHSSFLLNAISKIVFNTDNLSINKKDGSSDVFALANIRNLNFSNTTTLSVSDTKQENNNCLKLYPNPVVNQLHFQFTPSLTENTILHITNSQGCEIYQQTYDSRSAIISGDISVRHLTPGLYFCIMQNGNFIQTTKFIKY